MDPKPFSTYLISSQYYCIVSNLICCFSEVFTSLKFEFEFSLQRRLSQWNLSCRIWDAVTSKVGKEDGVELVYFGSGGGETCLVFFKSCSIISRQFFWLWVGKYLTSGPSGPLLYISSTFTYPRAHTWYMARVLIKEGVL